MSLELTMKTRASNLVPAILFVLILSLARLVLAWFLSPRLSMPQYHAPNAFLIFDR